MDHFSVLDDPRQSWKVVYPTSEIMLLVLCATLAAADSVEIRRWGAEKLDFLPTMLPFAQGIPSHDVLNALDPGLFSDCFCDRAEVLR